MGLLDRVNLADKAWRRPRVHTKLVSGPGGEVGDLVAVNLDAAGFPGAARAGAGAQADVPDQHGPVTAQRGGSGELGCPAYRGEAPHGVAETGCSEACVADLQVSGADRVSVF